MILMIVDRNESNPVSNFTQFIQIKFDLLQFHAVKLNLIERICITSFQPQIFMLFI